MCTQEKTDVSGYKYRIIKSLLMRIEWILGQVTAEMQQAVEESSKKKTLQMIVMLLLMMGYIGEE